MPLSNFRYLAWFDMFLTNIELSHPGGWDLLSKGAIAVARSLIPGAFAAVDKTMEETFIKFAKSSGLLQFSSDDKIIIVTTHTQYMYSTSLYSYQYTSIQVVCGASLRCLTHTHASAALLRREGNSLSNFSRCVA